MHKRQILSFGFPRPFFAGLVLALAVVGCGGSHSGSGASTDTGTTSGPTTGTASSFVETKLTADSSGVAAHTDANLKNPWGISFAPGQAFWVSDNGTGLSTLYDGTGATQPLVVKIPTATGTGNAKVTGTVYNGTGDFAVSGFPALFIFANEDGVISGWYTGTTASVAANRSAQGADYTGLALASSGGANFLYAANFSGGTIDVFDKTFTFTKSFTDPGIPAGFAPFNVQTINGQLYVTYAKQDPTKHFAVAGVGNGYVDIFNPNGTLVKELVSTGALNSPWGVAMAPSTFGSLASTLLVGNLGDGLIHGYNPTTGALVGVVSDSTNTPIALDGLWALTFGNGGNGGSASTLYFTAGPNGYANGLLGSIAPSAASAVRKP